MADPAVFPGGAPKGMRYDDRGHELSFSWRWFSGSDSFLVLFAVIWNAMVFAIAVGGGPLTMLSLHILAGLFVGYFALQRLVNRTHVELRPGTLSVRSGPIGAKQDVTVRPFDLKQLFVKRRTTGSVNGRPTYVFEVHAIVSDHLDDVLVAGNVPTLEQAHFIEAQVERYLEIPDQAVNGAIPRATSREDQFPVIPIQLDGSSTDQTAPNTRSELRDAVSETPPPAAAADWGGEIIDPNQA